MTIRKLSRQKDDVILRKAVRIIRQLELQDNALDIRYSNDLLELLMNNPLIDDPSRNALESCRLQLKEAGISHRRVLLSDVRYALMGLTGEQVGDWDFFDNDEFHGDRIVFPITVYTDRVRSPFNIGSIFRTAESFGVSRILVHPSSASPDHPRAKRSAMGCVEHIPWEYAYEDQVPLPVFALETGGVSIEKFDFPESASVVIGSEEFGVSPKMLEAADRSLGRVTIPTAGQKGSLNLSIAFGILMYQWFRSIVEGPVR